MMRSASSRFCSCSTTTTTPTFRGGGERKKGKRSPNEARFGRRRRLQRRSSSTTTSAEGGGSEEARTMKNDDDIDRSVDATMMGTTTTRTSESTNGTYIANSKVPKKLEPPKRDTGIPSELDINIDIDEGKKKKLKRKKMKTRASRKSNRWNVLMTFYIALSLFVISLWFVSLSLSLWFALNSNARRACKRATLTTPFLFSFLENENDRTHEEDERRGSGNRELVVSGERGRPRRGRVSVSMDGERRGGAG